MNPGTWPERSLLGQLRRRGRETLLSLGTPITYAARQTLLRQGEDDKHVLLLLSGCAKVVVTTEFGRDILVAVRGQGDLIGEMAVLEHRSRSASVIACSTVKARVVKGVELVEFLERNPEVCLTVARMISERLRVSDQRGVDFVVCPAPTRVVRVLIEIIDRQGSLSSAGWELGVPLTQTEIAALAGTALSTVEKAFQSLQREELVRRHYRRIVVTDIARLRKFAGLDD